MDANTSFIVSLLVIALFWAALFALSFIILKIEVRQKKQALPKNTSFKKVSVALNVVWAILIIPVTRMSFLVLTAQYMLPVSGTNSILLPLLLLLSVATPVWALFGVATSFYFRKKEQLALSAIAQILPTGGVVQLLFFNFWAL